MDVERTARTPDAELDGRVRRGKRNREQILDAFYSLVQEGNAAPTADQVAQRAGVGTRTVFRHFEDMESLLAACAAKVDAEIGQAFEGKPPQASLRVRLEGLIQLRCAFYPNVVAFHRAARLRTESSPYIRKRLAFVVAEFRTGLHLWLPELTRSARAVDLAAETLLSIDTWDQMTAQGASEAEAREAMTAALFALLLPGEPR